MRVQIGRWRGSRWTDERYECGQFGCGWTDGMCNGAQSRDDAGAVQETAHPERNRFSAHCQCIFGGCICLGGPATESTRREWRTLHPVCLSGRDRIASGNRRECLSALNTLSLGAKMSGCLRSTAGYRERSMETKYSTPVSRRLVTLDGLTLGGSR